MFDILRSGLLILVVPALVGYAVGFFAQRKFDKGLAPVVLLLLANGLLGILFHEAQHTGEVDTLTWLAGCSIALSACAAASSSWVFTRRHVVALPVSIILALAAAYISFLVWFSYVCRHPDYCNF